MDKSGKLADVIQINDKKMDEKLKVIAYRDARVRLHDDIEPLAILNVDKDLSYKFKIKDVSTFGARIFSTESDLAFKLNQKVDVSLSIQSIIILKGTATISNESSHDDGTSYGISFVDQFMDMDRVRAIISNSSTIQRFSSTSNLISLISDVKPEFKILVADLNSFFQDLKIKLEMEEKSIEKNAISSSHSKRMEEHALELAVNMNMMGLSEMFTKFQDIVNVLSPEQNLLHKKYFRLNFHNIINQTPFLKRAYEKPLGYAGDYGLMVMFYDYKDEGVNIFDRFIHRLSCNQPVAIANKNRVSYLSEIIQKQYEINASKKFKVSSIACGPAQEIKLFLERTPFKKDDTIEVTLLDQEGKALDYAIKSLKEVGNPRCNLKLKALKEDAVLGLIKKKLFVTELEGSDIIISAGLFDYLSDRVASKMIERMYEVLKPGGHIYIGNVSDENPNQFSMDYFMEWNLVLRSSSQMVNLIPPSIKMDSNVKFEVISESLGLNLFLKIEKPK